MVNIILIIIFKSNVTTSLDLHIKKLHLRTKVSATHSFLITFLQADFRLAIDITELQNLKFSYFPIQQENLLRRLWVSATFKSYTLKEHNLHKFDFIIVF